MRLSGRTLTRLVVIDGYVDHDPGDEDRDEKPGRIACVDGGLYGGRLMVRPSEYAEVTSRAFGDSPRVEGCR